MNIRSRSVILIIIGFVFVQLILVYILSSKNEKKIYTKEVKNFSKAIDNKDIIILSAWLRSRDKKTSHLKHVINGFKSFSTNISIHGLDEFQDNKWNIIWSYQNIPNWMKSKFHLLKNTHCINQFPGTGYITSKVFLAKSKISSIPKSFNIPEDKANFLTYTHNNKDKLFVKKSNQHRGIKIETSNKLEFDKKEAFFIQEFIKNPFLIDWYKFDIGVYAVIASFEPLRVYSFKDALFRFCITQYEPFSVNDTSKYVIGDSYRPIWKVESMKNLYIDHKLGSKDTFNIYMKKHNHQPDKIWSKIDSIIAEIFILNERHFIRELNDYPENLRFFELLRFDFILDDKLNVYLMEVNMSPNLSSAHFKESSVMFEQIVHDLLAMIGLAYNGCSDTTLEQKNMICSERDISVFPEHCAESCKNRADCHKINCQLCLLCLDSDQISRLRQAYLEHVWRGSYRRIFPKPISVENAEKTTEAGDLSPRNTLMHEWFRGKCLLDHTFCS